MLQVNGQTRKISIRAGPNNLLHGRMVAPNFNWLDWGLKSSAHFTKKLIWRYAKSKR
jgi:hypothetical protein